jgi:hypothetical protein
LFGVSQVYPADFVFARVAGEAVGFAAPRYGLLNACTSTGFRMLTFSVLWIVLAATVTVIAMLRRTGTDVKGEALVSESGKTIIVIAIVYSLVLVAGFLYVGWQHSLELIK